MMSSVSAASARSPLRVAVFTIPAIVDMGFLMGQLSNSGYGNQWFDALAVAYMEAGEVKQLTGMLPKEFFQFSRLED